MTNRLAQVLREWAERPFFYGADCCQFAGAVAEAVTGRNPMDGLHYTDEESANKLIARLGGLQSAISSVLGDPISIHETKTGDVLLIEMTNGKSLAGSCIDGLAVVKDLTGIRDLDLGVATMAWSV